MSEAEQVTKKYKDILLANGIHDNVAEVTVQDSGAKGDGMASVTKRVTVTFEDRNKAPLNLFVKLHTDNPSHEAMLDDLKAFEKEARYLMEYVPAAKKFCESKGLKNFIDFYPKCYYGDERMIVLENLIIEKGYQMLPHEQRHDLKTAILAMKMLAKHHAISYAMIKDNGGEEKFFERFPNLEHDGLSSSFLVELMANSMEKSLKVMANVVEKNKPEGSNKILATLNSLSGSCADIMVDALKTNEKFDKLVLLNHGDYKNNNMMALMDKETNAVKHLISIDLQIVRYSSPAVDLCFYLYSSVEPAVRQSRLEELLNIYRETLNKVSKDLGYPIDLSYEDLLMQYRRKFKYGFLFGLGLIGPGMKLLKMVDYDLSKVDMHDLFQVFEDCLNKWMEDNPEKGVEMAEDVKKAVEEYQKLAL